MREKGERRKEKINLEQTKALYTGFYIDRPQGNNAFSYHKRKNKRIFVPALQESAIERISLGEKIVFSEVENGKEYNRCGLKNFIYSYVNGTHIFIFDNHNHAFFFWMLGYLQGAIEKGRELVHIDQHSDMREPQRYYPNILNEKISLVDVFEYTNYMLNVGNFIKPALNCGLFSAVKIIDSSETFERRPYGDFVLDIDMDIFSDDMRYISEHKKMRRIKDYLARTDFVTIATSPYFIKQEKAVTLTKQLFY